MRIRKEGVRYPKTGLARIRRLKYRKGDTIDTLNRESSIEWLRRLVLTKPKYHIVSKTPLKVSKSITKVSSKSVYLTSKPAIGTKHFITGNGKVRRI